MLFRRFIERMIMAFNLWLDRAGPVHSAAVAYYAALSIFPILLLNDACFHLISNWLPIDTRPDAVFLQVIEEEASLQLRNAVEKTLETTRNSYSVGGPAGLAGLLVMSLLVFAEIDRGFHKLWNVWPQRRSNIVSTTVGMLGNRTRAFVLLVTFGVIFACAYGASITLDGVARLTNESGDAQSFIAWDLRVAMHLILHTLFFGGVFMWFHPSKVSIKDAAHSAFLRACCWELGRQVMAAMVVRDYNSLYGICGAFMMILLWTDYVSMLIFYAAAYLQCLVDEHEAAG